CESLAWALLSFNAGVELGQVAIVLVFAPALALLVKARPRLRMPIVFYGSTAVAAVGAFWFSQRLFSV
ncbi:MAG TPA: HupE/UreJ family protein, partial [Abditibacteriaceae bacterium]